MKNKTKQTILAITLLATTTCSLPYAFATTLHRAQNCELGETCKVPGSDGGQTTYSVTPKSGFVYQCDVKSDGGSLKFSITSGEDFNITQGSGLYNANPASAVEIKGRFANPENTNEKGLIKITKLPLSSDGTVKCYPKK